jgi:hypothetical protein
MISQPRTHKRAVLIAAYVMFACVAALLSVNLTSPTRAALALTGSAAGLRSYSRAAPRCVHTRPLPLACASDRGKAVITVALAKSVNDTKADISASGLRRHHWLVLTQQRAVYCECALLDRLGHRTS